MFKRVYNNCTTEESEKLSNLFALEPRTDSLQAWYSVNHEAWYKGEIWYPKLSHASVDPDYQDFVVEEPNTVFYLQEMVEVGDFYSRVIAEVAIEEEEVQ